MVRPPADTDARRIGSRARAILHYQLDARHWDYREDLGGANGRDCVIELSEGSRWLGHRVEGLVQGTRNPRLSGDGSFYSVSVETEALEYALGTPNAFVLFLVDVAKETVWFASIQDFFIDNPRLFAKLRRQKTLRVRVPADALLVDREAELLALAATAYSDGPGPSLRRYAAESGATSRRAARGSSARQGQLF